MQVKQIAIVAAIASTFAAMPITAQASDIATLNGWGSLFAAAHSGQQAAAQGQAQGEIKVSLFQRQQPPAAQPAPEAMPEPTPVAEPTPATEPAPTAEAPEMNQPETGNQSVEAAQEEMGQAMASANASLSATVNVSGEQLGQVLNTVDGVYQTAGTVVEGVTGGVLGTVQNVADMTSGASLAADMAGSGSLNIAGLASANLAGNLGATASMMSAGQLSSITAVTSSLIQNVIAARPASLTGLLR